VPNTWVYAHQLQNSIGLDDRLSAQVLNTELKVTVTEQKIYVTRKLHNRHKADRRRKTDRQAKIL
jgi:hypothetical protein